MQRKASRLSARLSARRSAKKPGSVRKGRLQHFVRDSTSFEWDQLDDLVAENAGAFWRVILRGLSLVVGQIHVSSSSRN